MARRGVKGTEKGGQQHVARRQIGDGIDLLCRDDDPIDDARFHLGLLKFGGEVLQDLGRGSDVFVAHDDGGLPFQAIEFRQTGVLRGAAQKGVLHDVAAGTDIPKAVP